MGWSVTSDLERFAATAGGYLRARAAENTLLLSAAQDAQRHQAQPQSTGMLFGWWTPPDGEDPRGAFVHDPAEPLLISGRVPEMASALAATLAKLGRQVRGVDAPTEVADAFAAAWSQRAGMSVRAHRTCRVYRLAASSPDRPELPGPPCAPGRLRIATSADHATLADWLRVAAIEAAERLPSPSDLATDLLSYGGAFFWEVPHKSGRIRDVAHYLAIPHHRDMAQFGEPVPQPVALVTLTRPVAGIVRISMIYTLPDRRRSGYAAAATQAVSRALLRDSGPGRGPDTGMLGHGCITEVVMITDKNRSDHWGGRVGYQQISERAVLRFGPATGAIPRVNSTNSLPRLPTGPLPRLPRIGRGTGRL
ncbi:MAG TPA: hypothetical protein VFG87_02340 [Amycolatopsis sp.]|jgi:hypothetical protein|nr:hypothetical protein [Amycolatopsis sp.]